MLFVLSSLSSGPDRNATVLRIWGPSIHRAKKTLATAAFSDDIVAVRHDLPHMPSLGVSSLDSRPPWQHGGLLYFLPPGRRSQPERWAFGAPLEKVWGHRRRAQHSISKSVGIILLLVRRNVILLRCGTVCRICPPWAFPP